MSVVTQAASSVKHNVTVWRPSVRLSVCPVGILTVTQQSDAASVHFSKELCCVCVLGVWWLLSHGGATASSQSPTHVRRHTPRL